MSSNNPKKRRRRNDLGPTAHQERYAAHQERYAAPSQLADAYLGGSRARAEVDGRGAFLASRRASVAAQASWQPPSVLVSPEEPSYPNVHLYGAGMAADRRSTIRYWFEYVMDSPPEEDWGGRGGTIATIYRDCRIPAHSARSVYRNGVEDNIDRHSVEWCH
jgi:hypothetical protein